MDDVPSLILDSREHTVRLLTINDCPWIQSLLEGCSDFMLLVEGLPAAPNAAEEEFLSTPPGRSVEDKFMFGIEDKDNALVGLLDVFRNYPEEATWWIGLLLFAPEVRGQGIGQKVVNGFAEFVRAAGGHAIMLGVVEENSKGYNFWSQMGFELVRTTDPQQFGNKTQRVNVMRKLLLEK